MNQRQIDRFFRVLARHLNRPARIILTGASAGSIWGSVRPSLDVDFAIIPSSARRGEWKAVDAAMTRTVRLTGIQANYAEDIDRWGQISLMDYRRRTRPYKRFGRLEVRLLDPAYWAIGKLTRYLDPDVQDLVTVLTRQRVSPVRLVGVLARAVRRSPRSHATMQFRRQVEHFLRTYGRSVWASGFDAEAAVRRFHRLAGLHQSS